MLCNQFQHTTARRAPFGVQRPTGSRPTGSTVARGLKENVQALPSIDGISQVVLQPLGHVIPNQEGKKASVAIYHHLAQKYAGSLTPAAAQEGLDLYDEVVADARAHPGSHPNIDILLDALQKPELQIRIEVERQQ